MESTSVPTETNSTRVFSSKFLAEMQAYLLANTENDACVTRTKLCEDLGLELKMDAVIGAIIKLGHMPDFKIWMGPGGGIGRTDRQSSKKDREPGAYAPKLSDEDAAKILAKVEEMCGGGLIVPRRKVAAAMGNGSTKMQNLISAALKRPEFADFATKNGKGGGIYKISLRPDLVKKVRPTLSQPTVSPAVAVTPPEPAVEPSEAITEPAPASTPVPQEADLSAPLDTTLEQAQQKLSPLERRWAEQRAAKASDSADAT